MLKKTLFNTVIYRGTIGSIYGIVSGLLLGLLIWILLQVAVAVNMSLNTHIYAAASVSPQYSGPPFEFFVTLGMCFGALLGSIFGGVTALKEKK